MTGRRVLVAGIGNVFLGDDGFGVEVVAELAKRQQPDGVEVADFGIRGFDLAYSLMDGYDAAVLVDALPLGRPPGTVSVLEADLDERERRDPPTQRSGGLGGAYAVDLGEAYAFDSHGMTPTEVLRLVRHLGGRPPRVLVVGCEPESLGPENEGRMGLSQVVDGAVGEAVRIVERLVPDLLAVAPLEVT
ncbi:MAG TPA: hydrogenase maturation protease [Candidatus Dormibacteraeota bacterium]